MAFYGFCMVQKPEASWSWDPREATEGELEGEFLMFLVSCSTVFIPVRNYSFEFTTKPLLRKNLCCGLKNFKNQTVLGNVVRLKSSLKTCYLATLFTDGHTKICHGSNKL